MSKIAQRQQLGALLGLLALLLIVLAPLFSQLKAANGDWSWLAELACHDSQASSGKVVSDLYGKTDACGYCSLLISSPALASAAWSAPVIPVRPAQQNEPARLTLIVATLIHGRPRAPPLVLV